jgi:hypothetical protein
MDKIPVSLDVVRDKHGDIKYVDIKGTVGFDAKKRPRWFWPYMLYKGINYPNDNRAYKWVDASVEGVPGLLDLLKPIDAELTQRYNELIDEVNNYEYVNDYMFGLKNRMVHIDNILKVLPNGYITYVNDSQRIKGEWNIIGLGVYGKASITMEFKLVDYTTNTIRWAIDFDSSKH